MTETYAQRVERRKNHERATNFDDIDIKPNPGHIPNAVICPICKGHGRWNLTTDAYGKGQHFQQSCHCGGFGWVDSSDPQTVCDHDYFELSAQQAREHGMQHWGNCWHVVKCRKCSKVTAYDSSG